MRINITGTRPGKAKPTGGKKNREAGQRKAKLTRAQKIKKRRAAARERRIVVGVERYRITLHPKAASTTTLVYARMHGDDDTEGYPGRYRGPLIGRDDTEGYPGKPNPPPTIVPDEQPKPRSRKERGS